MKQLTVNQQTPNFRRQRPEAVDNENVAPHAISENSLNQEFTTEIDIDKSIGGVSQGQQSKKSSKTAKNKKKNVGGEKSAGLRLQEQLNAPKSPGVVLNERKQLTEPPQFKRMQTMLPHQNKPKLGESKPSDRYADDLKSQASRKSANTYQRSQTFKMAEGSDAGELKIENDRLQTTILILNQKLKTQNDSDAQINGLRKKLKESEEQQQEYSKNNMSLKHEISQLKSENSFLQSQISDLETTIDSLNLSIREKDDEMDKTEEQRADLKQDIEELNGNLQSQEEELYTVKKELHETNQELEETNQELEERNQELHEAMEQLKAIDEEWSAKYQKAQEKIHKVMTDLEECMKGTQHICIGHKMDKIDRHLANYINQYPERDNLKVLFLRESEGVYQFGQKRVYVKIEKGNQIQVRVGGGFMHIDDFIDLYTPQEVEKIERNDVIGRFQNKLQAQKISSEMSNNAYEFNPINDPQRPSSPNARRKGSPARRSPKRRSIVSGQMSPGRGSLKSAKSPSKRSQQNSNN